MRPRQINLRRHPQSPDTPLVHPLNSINDSLASFPRQIDRRSSIQRHNIERKFLASIIYINYSIYIYYSSINSTMIIERNCFI